MTDGSDTNRPSERGGDQRREGGGERGGEDLRFLELELGEALYGKATLLAREAYHKLLVKRIRARLEERLGDQIDALAELAADDLIADIEANLDIERRIKERARLREHQLDRVKVLFGLDKPMHDIDD